MQLLTSKRSAHSKDCFCLFVVSPVAKVGSDVFQCFQPVSKRRWDDFGPDSLNLSAPLFHNVIWFVF